MSLLPFAAPPGITSHNIGTYALLIGGNTVASDLLLGTLNNHNVSVIVNGTVIGTFSSSGLTVGTVPATAGSFTTNGSGNLVLTPGSGGTTTILASGSLTFTGSSSGTTTLAAAAAASGALTLPAATDTLVGKATTDTLTNKTLTAAKIASGGFLADANGNELIIFTTTASAVNELTFANGSTGVNPKWTASGETNVGMDFQAKGTGTYRFLGTASQAAELRLYEDTDDGTNYTAFKVGTQAADITYTMPTAVPAVDGYVLSATTAGIQSWVNSGAVTVQAKTSGTSLAATETGKIITNEGASALLSDTLPTAAAGMRFTYIVQDSDGIRVNANTGDTIRIAGDVTASAGHIDSTAIGDSITLVSINATEWIATSVSGTWSLT